MSQRLPKDLPPEEYQAAAEKNPAGYWTPAMVSLVLGDGVHHVFRETVFVNKHETPTPATTHKFKLTMSNGDTFWVTVTPEDKP